MVILTWASVHDVQPFTHTCAYNYACSPKLERKNMEHGMNEMIHIIAVNTYLYSINCLSCEFFETWKTLFHSFKCLLFFCFCFIQQNHTVQPVYCHNSQWHRIIITPWTTLMRIEYVKCTQIGPFSSPVAPVSLAKCSSRNFWGKILRQKYVRRFVNLAALHVSINRFKFFCDFRTCPEIEKLYLLVRPKRGKKPKDRLHDIFDNAVNWIQSVIVGNIIVEWAGRDCSGLPLTRSSVHELLTT